MSSPSLVLVEWLLSQMLVGSVADSSPVWPCYLVSLPEGPGVPTDAVCVYDTNPVLDGRLMASGEQIVHPGVQVKVRALDYQTGWAKIREISTAMDALRNASVVIDSIETQVLQNASRISGPLSIGTDQASPVSAYHFTVNYQLTLLSA